MLIAIVLGFVLGLVITFGLWSANKAMKSKEALTETEETTTPTLIPTPTPVQVFSLAILAPEDESVHNTEKIIISGTTEPEAQVAVIGEKDEKVVSADTTGKFEVEIMLENGTNEITVSAANEAGEEITKTVSVVYTTVEF